jgi:CheY-like chemotaxis protein
LEFLQQRKKIYDRQRMKIKRVKQSRGKVLDAMAVGKKKKQADNLDAFAAGFTRYLKKSMVPATATASSAAVPTAASTTASTTDAAMSDEEVQAIASSLGQASFEETGTDRPAWVPAGSS